MIAVSAAKVIALVTHDCARRADQLLPCAWFAAIWHVVSQKQGVSALGLQRVLGFGSYQTAWAWLHKLRRAIVLPGPRAPRRRGRGPYIGGARPGERPQHEKWRDTTLRSCVRDR